MTTQPDPTIRERLRELAEKARMEFWDPWSMASWRKGEGDQAGMMTLNPYTTPDNAAYIAACDPDTIKALLDELDTLERRVRAAEELRDAAEGVVAAFENYGSAYVGLPVLVQYLTDALDAPKADHTMTEPKRTVKIASTRYSSWVEVECVQMCGWKPSDQRTTEAVKHTKATGHETAVTHHSSIHYHPRSLISGTKEPTDG